MQVARYLEMNNVPYHRLAHRPTNSARDLARVIHLPGEMVCKTVLMFAERLPTLLILPAAKRVDFSRLSAALNTEDLRLADEDDLACLFSDCELGVIPPFGSQYDIRTFVDASLVRKPEIVFAGNSHGEAYRISSKDFLAMEQPEVLDFAR